jgi:predicted RNA binding protein YcfA (HicA-like mRNA interferase family)
MRELPVLSGNKLVAVPRRIGYHMARPRGSHMRLACPGRKSITVPNYRTIDRLLLLKILRDAELSREEFLKLV